MLWVPAIRLFAVAGWTVVMPMRLVHRPVHVVRNPVAFLLVGNLMAETPSVSAIGAAIPVFTYSAPWAFNVPWSRHQTQQRHSHYLIFSTQLPILRSKPSIFRVNLENKPSIFREERRVECESVRTDATLTALGIRIKFVS
jgi:hypothetical protein